MHTININNDNNIYILIQLEYKHFGNKNFFFYTNFKNIEIKKMKFWLKKKFTANITI